MGDSAARPVRIGLERRALVENWEVTQQGVACAPRRTDSHADQGAQRRERQADPTAPAPAGAQRRERQAAPPRDGAEEGKGGGGWRAMVVTHLLGDGRHPLAEAELRAATKWRPNGAQRRKEAAVILLRPAIHQPRQRVWLVAVATETKPTSVSRFRHLGYKRASSNWIQKHRSGRILPWQRFSFLKLWAGLIHFSGKQPFAWRHHIQAKIGSFSSRFIRNCFIPMAAV
jgi:hypothetical protein